MKLYIRFYVQDAEPDMLGEYEYDEFETFIENFKNRLVGLVGYNLKVTDYKSTQGGDYWQLVLKLNLSQFRADLEFINKWLHVVQNGMIQALPFDTQHKFEGIEWAWKKPHRDWAKL